MMRDKPRPSIRRNPDTGMSIVTIPEDIPVIAVEFESTTRPPEPWGAISPDGPAIRDRFMDSPSVMAAYACPHGAVAIVLLDKNLHTAAERKMAWRTAVKHLLQLLPGGEGKPRIRAKPVEGEMSCTRPYKMDGEENQ